MYGEGFGSWNQSGLFQMRAVHPILNGDTNVEVDLVREDFVSQVESPVLSGVIFEHTGHGLARRQIWP